MKNGMVEPDWNGARDRQAARKAAIRRLAYIGMLALLSVGALAANPTKDQAKRMYDRIAGVPASDTLLTQMTQMDANSAALLATQDAAFYNNTIRDLATPWTNRDQTVFAPLNDYTATVIGMVRDDVPFNTLLSADLVYIADSAANVPAYSPANNDMYEALDTDGTDLKAHLVSSTQSALTGVPAAATAGVLTTRAAAAAFFINGTNRAMFRFTMMNHLCDDLQTIMDTTRPPDRIRQDVTRSPGGDSSLFLNNCIGCHSGMDPMAQAFAYYNFSNTDTATAASTGQIVYTAGQVQPKYFINSTNFPQGYVTPDDRWDNRWRTGVNQLLGWDSAQTGSGHGAKSLGQELAGSQAFASCQVTRVFKYVCFRAPSDAADRTQVATMTAAFKSNGYKLRQVFADAAVYCMGN
ncbi:MAG: hypothetical protein M3N97_14450 [Pseudomonadota bacterium]|nr:hypothetical protein [Pseudomonadota bacterium]